ncbi:hypothetical protein WR25_23969 [Diploscapter pachys]|uniref:Uncharacterized protein n=1 Tax=Diploscapter pachys TaxID=2018661 RepID=A0A2A2M1L2_9BILA|nr:hypothetical protein WR25_23969 [Diploscapter pachys]
MTASTIAERHGRHHGRLKAIGEPQRPQPLAARPGLRDDRTIADAAGHPPVRAKRDELDAVQEIAAHRPNADQADGPAFQPSLRIIDGQAASDTAGG